MLIMNLEHTCQLSFLFAIIIFGAFMLIHRLMQLANVETNVNTTLSVMFALMFTLCVMHTQLLKLVENEEEEEDVHDTMDQVYERM